MRELIFLFVMSFSVNAAEDLSNQIRIVEVAGAVKEVKVIRAVGKKEAPLRSGEILFVGDEVQVAPRQVVVLQAYDGSQWKLAPETQFRIESRKPDPKTFAYWTFQLTKGSM